MRIREFRTGLKQEISGVDFIMYDENNNMTRGIGLANQTQSVSAN